MSDPENKTLHIPQSRSTAGLGATHWIDARKLVLTDKQREELGSDYKHAYNVPCEKVRGKVKPLHVCPRCNGTGDEPEAEYDRCEKCHGAGGLPKAPNAKTVGPDAALSRQVGSTDGLCSSATAKGDE